MSDPKEYLAMVLSGDKSADPAEVAQLSDKDLNILKFNIGYAGYRLRRLQDFVKAESIHRRNDYKAMVKEARQRFTDDDCKILQMLHGNDETSWYARGIAEETELDLATVKASLKKLKRRGLVEVRNGLFDEDGLTAGSGYSEVPRHYDVVESILNLYENHQQALI